MRSLHTIDAAKAAALTLLLGFVTLPAAAQTAAPAETTIYSLTGGADGNSPESALLADKNGVLYGTSFLGGPWGKGAIFSLTPPAAAGGAWTPSVLHSFQGRGDGANPAAPLVMDRNGVLYGTTLGSNGISYGNLFSLTPPSTPGGTWTETVLWNFTVPNGIQPLGALLMTRNGTLIGATQTGGGYDGTVFALKPPASPGGGWTFHLLHVFNHADGSAPGARLIADQSGALYSTTYRGGANNAGTIFKLTPPAKAGGTWTESVLYSFTGGVDGGNPAAGLVAAADGTLYGTTQLGGTYNQGAVFSLSPSGTYTVLYSFTGGSDGAQPYSDLVLNARGALIGTTSQGGGAAVGTVFALAHPAAAGGAWTLNVLHSFSGSDGASPMAGVIPYGGALYGATSGGGANGFGAVFQLK